MPALRLWIETTHHAAFRHGGWAYLRESDGVVAGTAGGERSLDAGRLNLTALVALLTGLPAGAALPVQTSSPALAEILRAAVAQEAPTEDTDLWAKLLTLAKGRTIQVQLVARAPQTPAAFLVAWAEVGRDKAKGAGRFSAAIPKSNLAKLTLN